MKSLKKKLKIISSEQYKSVEKAVIIVQELFKCAAKGSDDDLAELIDEIHPNRAVKKTSEFLNFVAQHEAWCTPLF